MRVFVLFCFKEMFVSLHGLLMLGEELQNCLPGVLHVQIIACPISAAINVLQSSIRVSVKLLNLMITYFPTVNIASSTIDLK